MDTQTVGLVQSTWKQVAVLGPPAAKLFYDNLFKADPSLQPLFKGNMDDQGKKLLQMIGVAVSKLNDLDTLVPVLQALARRHVTYGVKDAHYDTVGAALLTTLEQGLGEEFTPDVKDAWTAVYTVMAGVMVSASRAES